jgi:hypothetical protein
VIKKWIYVSFKPLGSVRKGYRSAVSRKLKKYGESEEYSREEL